METRTTADVQAEIDRISAEFRAAKTALKLTPSYDSQRDAWRHAVATYQGRLSNLTEELRRARMREGR